MPIGGTDEADAALARKALAGDIENNVKIAAPSNVAASIALCNHNIIRTYRRYRALLPKAPEVKLIQISVYRSGRRIMKLGGMCCSISGDYPNMTTSTPDDRTRGTFR